MLPLNDEITCAYAHRARDLCISHKCPLPSVMCSVEGCKYNQFHRPCSFVSIQQTLQFLQQKAQLYYKKIDLPVINGLERIINTLEVLKEEREKTKDDASLRLWGKDKELYLMLKSQNISKLQPWFVAEVVAKSGQRLTDEQGKAILEQRANQTKEMLDRMEGQMERVMEHFRNLWGFQYLKKVYCQYSFDEKLCDPQFSAISHNGKRLKQAFSDEIFHVSLITPSISDSNNGNKITLKLLNAQSYIRIGVARKQIVEEEGWAIPKDFQGISVIGSSGLIWNSFDESQNYASCGVKAMTGDEITMEYMNGKNQLVVTNHTNRTRHTLQNIPNLEKDLYYCVLGDEADSSVEIIKNKS